MDRERWFRDFFSTDKENEWEMLREFWRFLDITWHTGNFLGRIFIVFLVGWPILLAYFAAFGGGTAFTGALAIIPFITATLAISVFPVIDAIALANGKGRKIFKWIMAIVGIELVIGIYVSVVPLSNDAGLVPVLVATFAALLTIYLSGKLKRIRTLLWIFLIVLTIIFIKGGREKISSTANAQQTGAPAQTQYEMQNGYRIKKPGMPLSAFTIPETSKKISQGGSRVVIETNCVDFLHGIMPIRPGEKVKITHVNMAPDFDRNRCSYNIAGDTAPIAGGMPGEKTLPWYKQNLPYPDFPAYALVFILTDSSGIIAKGHIKDEGQYLILENTGTQEAILHADYNYLPQYMDQVGLAGKTVTVSFDAYN